MAHHFVNFLSNILTTWLALYYFSIFGEKKNLKKSVRILLPLLALCFAQIGSTFVLYSSAWVLPMQLISLFLLSVLYKGKWYWRILQTFFYYLLLGLSEMFIGMLYNLLFGYFVQARDNVFVYAACAGAARVITFFVVRLMKLIMKKQYAVDLKYIVLLLPLPVATLINMFIFVKTCYAIVDKQHSALTAVISVLLVLANIAVFVFIDRMSDYTEQKADLMLYEREYLSQQQHLAALQEHLHETRAFRHDSKNKMLTLIGLMQAGEYEKALAEMQRSLNQLDTVAQDIVNTNHPIMDALLQQKLREQKPNGIYIKPMIRICDPLLINEIDMGILLGNMVDNAIEATARLDPQLRIPIEVRIICMDGMVSVQVCNAVALPVNTQHLQTVKKDKNNHGFGISQIKKTAAKYDGRAEFSCDGNVFTANVIMVNKPRG